MHQKTAKTAPGGTRCAKLTALMRPWLAQYLRSWASYCLLEVFHNSSIWFFGSFLSTG
jgi:hypothetical protein